MNRYEARIRESAPEGTEIYNLSMREAERGWKAWLSAALPIPISGYRTFTEAAGAYYLVGSGDQWQVCTMAKDLTETWEDVSASLATAKSRKSFDHNGLTYMVAAKIR
ncbi:MAG: hypothetical protein Q4G67_05320 [Actinomycetia bacterium]|nr:hypothetical protein [Actinomycetes bacterium]